MSETEKNKEYAVTFKVQNNYLLRKMKAAGYKSAAELSRATGVTQMSIGKLLNLKLSGLTAFEAWRSVLVKLAEHLRCLPEDLIPPQHHRSALSRNTAELEMSASEIGQLLSSQSQQSVDSPERAMERSEALNAINEALSTLTAREERIVRLRFGLGVEEQTLNEIAQRFDRSRERIRGIEGKALRKLMHHSRANPLRPLWLDNDLCLS